MENIIKISKKDNDFLNYHADSIDKLEGELIDFSMSIVHQIRILLGRKGWSQTDLANKLGKSRSEVSKWFRGEHNFSLKTLLLIQNELDEKILLLPYQVEREKIRLYSEAERDVESFPLDNDQPKARIYYFQEEKNKLNNLKNVDNFMPFELYDKAVKCVNE